MRTLLIYEVKITWSEEKERTPDRKFVQKFFDFDVYAEYWFKVNEKTSTQRHWMKFELNLTKKRKYDRKKIDTRINFLTLSLHQSCWMSLHLIPIVCTIIKINYTMKSILKNQVFSCNHALIFILQIFPCYVVCHKENKDVRIKRYK